MKDKDLEIVRLRQIIIALQGKINTANLDAQLKHQKNFNKLIKENIDLLKEMADLKENYEDMANLLYVVTRKPDEIDKVRKIMQIRNFTKTVDNYIK